MPEFRSRTRQGRRKDRPTATPLAPAGSTPPKAAISAACAPPCRKLAIRAAAHSHFLRVRGGAVRGGPVWGPQCRLETPIHGGGHCAAAASFRRLCASRLPPLCPVSGDISGCAPNDSVAPRAVRVHPHTAPHGHGTHAEGCVGVQAQTWCWRFRAISGRFGPRFRTKPGCK